MTSSTLIEVSTGAIVKNPNNPRRYFNEERLDLLRTSLQEVGVLVPLIVYRNPADPSMYVLMDGERRWRSAIDIDLESVPANVIDVPSELDNLLRMFNIHNVREDWPLISVALSLRHVMDLAQETGEKRLAEITGLTRSTVRRAKRLLSLPDSELELIQSEAHLDRTKQVHREDLYLEIQAAESVLRSELPEAVDGLSRDVIIRKFAEKAEVESLGAVTDFRFVAKLVKAIDDDIVSRDTVIHAVKDLVADVHLSPRASFDEIASYGYRQQNIQRKAQLLNSDLVALGSAGAISDALLEQLRTLQAAIDSVIGARQ